MCFNGSLNTFVFKSVSNWVYNQDLNIIAIMILAIIMQHSLQCHNKAAFTPNLDSDLVYIFFKKRQTSASEKVETSSPLGAAAVHLCCIALH